MLAKQYFLVTIFTLCTIPITKVFGDFLDDYFGDKTFGPNPGPCVNRGDCNVNLDPPFEWPQGIGDIEVALIDTGVGSFFKQPIKDWVQGGYLQIWNLQCSNLGVGEIDLTTTLQTSSRERSRITVNQALQVCYILG